MKSNFNIQDGAYWKLQYDQLKKQKRIFYNNEANQSLIVQLQDKCQKQEQTIDQLNRLLKQNSPTKQTDVFNDSEIQKLQHKAMLEQKDTIIVSLQRDNLNIQKVALEQLKKSDNHIESLRFQIQQLKQEVEDQNQLVNHLQQKLQQEQQETKEFKDKIIICEKMNEALEQTIDSLNVKLQASKEKNTKDLAQMMSKYKKSDQEYQNIKNKLEEISKTQFGKYGSENLDLSQIVDKINERVLQLQDEKKKLKQENQSLNNDTKKLAEKKVELENQIAQLQNQLQDIQADINYQKLKEIQQTIPVDQEDENKEQEQNFPVISLNYQNNVENTDSKIEEQNAQE